MTLFHCSLRHEVNNRSGDTVLEFEAALSELLSPSSGLAVDAIIAAFPRLSNSCAENKGSDLILLRVQERWIDLILNSKPYQCLKECAVAHAPELSLFTIFRAYLSNFEHVISLNKDLHATAMNFGALERIVDGVLNYWCNRERLDNKRRPGGGRRGKAWRPLILPMWMKNVSPWYGMMIP